MKSRLLLLCIAPLFCATAWAVDNDVSQQIQQLQSGGEAAHKAANELASAPAEQAVPALIEALQSDDAELQWRAARSLARFGDQAAAAVPPLVKALESTTPRVRAYAAYALGQLGDHSLEAVPQMIKLIADEDALVRRTAMKAVVDLDADPRQTLPILVNVLEEADPRLIVPVLHEMAEAGTNAIPQLKEALKNERAAYWATLVVAEMGEAAAPVVPELVALLDHNDPETRMQALIALGEIGPKAKPALPKTLELLKSDPEGAVRYSAAFALAELEDAQATNALLEAAKGDDAFLSVISYYAVARLNPEDEQKRKTAAVFLVEAMKNDDANIRAAAARSLAHLEVAPEVIKPILADSLDNADPRVVALLRDAIVKMGPQGVPEITAMLSDEQLRWIAVDVIRHWGEAAPNTIEPLREALKTEDEAFQAEVLMAIGAIGDKSVGALEDVRKFLKSPSRTLQLNALYALGRMGSGAVSAKDEIAALMASEDSFTRFAAAWALAHVAPEDAPAAKQAVPILAEGLQSSDGAFAAEAAKSLMLLGEHAKQAVPALREAASEGNEAAAEALKALNP